MATLSIDENVVHVYEFDFNTYQIEYHFRLRFTYAPGGNGRVQLTVSPSIAVDEPPTGLVVAGFKSAKCASEAAKYLDGFAFGDSRKTVLSADTPSTDRRLSFSKPEMAVDNQVDVNELAEVEAQEAEIEADNPSLGTEDTALGGEGDGDRIATAGCPVEAMLKAVPQQEPRREEELDRIQNDEAIKMISVAPDNIREDKIREIQKELMLDKQRAQNAIRDHPFLGDMVNELRRCPMVSRTMIAVICCTLLIINDPRHIDVALLIKTCQTQTQLRALIHSMTITISDEKMSENPVLEKKRSGCLIRRSLPTAAI
eukprot:gene5931-7134_t